MISAALWEEDQAARLAAEQAGIVKRRDAGAALAHARADYLRAYWRIRETLHGLA